VSWRNFPFHKRVAGNGARRLAGQGIDRLAHRAQAVIYAIKQGLVLLDEL